MIDEGYLGSLERHTKENLERLQAEGICILQLIEEVRRLREVLFGINESHDNAYYLRLLARRALGLEE